MPLLVPQQLLHSSLGSSASTRCRHQLSGSRHQKVLLKSQESRKMTRKDIPDVQGIGGKRAEFQSMYHRITLVINVII